jgi:hypothetical protein
VSERLKAWYRMLDARQRTRGFMIAASVLVLLLSGLTWGRLVLEARDLSNRRGELVEALTGQSLRQGDPLAVDLAERGVITVGGREYGDPILVEQADLMFDPEGVIEYPEGLAEVLLRQTYPQNLPVWLLEQPRTTLLLGGVSTTLLVLVVGSASTVALLLSAFGAALALGVAMLLGHPAAGWAVAAMIGLTFAYLLLSKLVMQLLDSPHRVPAVAHTVMKEATRTGIPLVFVVLLLVLLPLLPLGLDPDAPLRYRVQTFLSRSMGLSFTFAACMTLFLACGTVAFEIRDRQIWQVVAKPVSRGAYLLGKWLGLVAVNVVIMAIASLSIFGYVQYMRQLPVAPGIEGQEDLQQLREAVLVARDAMRPEYPQLAPEQIRTRVDQRIQRDAELAMMADVPLETRRRLASEVMDEWSRLQRSVPPQRTRELVFRGLDRDFAGDEMLTLRYRFHIMRDDEHQTFPAAFRFNKNPDLVVERTYVPTMTHVVTVPASFVQPDGTLVVEVGNMFEGIMYPNGQVAGQLNWDPEGLELLYRVSSFEANFARAMLVNLTKLAFLAMLGIACGTFLNFPVACLAAFTVFVAGSMGPFLARSLEYYGPVPLHMVDWTNIGMAIGWITQTAIKLIALVTVFLLESFGEIRPTQRVVDGRLVAWADVLQGFLRIGLLWSGLVLLVGWGVMRRRQLAIYSGQGG